MTEREKVACAIEASTAPTLEAEAVKRYVADCVRRGIKPTYGIETEEDYWTLVSKYSEKTQ